MPAQLNVKVEAFEGPMDLLLHLITKNRIDIYDIPIAELADQYLDYVQRMQEQDLDIASGFLVMAATLLNIKARMLLPKETSEDGEEEDPRADLVEQILQYKLYKSMSAELRARYEDSDKIIFRPRSMPPEVLAYEEPVDMDALTEGWNLRRLEEVFQSVMRRAADKKDPIRSKFREIKKEPVSMEEVTLRVDRYAKTHKRFSFRSLLEKQGSRAELITAFLVILEYMRNNKLIVSQENLFDDIIIESKITEGV